MLYPNDPDEFLDDLQTSICYQEIKPDKDGYYVVRMPPGYGLSEMWKEWAKKMYRIILVDTAPTKGRSMYTSAPWTLQEDGKLTGHNNEIIGTINVASQADRDLIQVAPILMENIADSMETLGNISHSISAMLESDISDEERRVSLGAMAGICLTASNRLARIVKTMGSR